MNRAAQAAVAAVAAAALVAPAAASTPPPPTEVAGVSLDRETVVEAANDAADVVAAAAPAEALAAEALLPLASAIDGPAAPVESPPTPPAAVVEPSPPALSLPAPVVDVPADAVAEPPPADPTTATAPPAGPAAVVPEPAAPPPPARFAVDDQVTTAGPVRVPVLANDGAAGLTIDPSTLEILDGPSHSVGHRGGTGGAMTGDGVIAYIPEPRFVGVDSITYRVCSTVGRCDVATVVFTVTDR